MAFECTTPPRDLIPISSKEAYENVIRYLGDNNFKPADFQAFYFHKAEIEKVMSLNPADCFIKFTLGRRPFEEFHGDVYGCVMMTSSSMKEEDATFIDDDNIYDFSRPVPPYPPEG